MKTIVRSIEPPCLEGSLLGPVAPVLLGGLWEAYLWSQPTVLFAHRLKGAFAVDRSDQRNSGTGGALSTQVRSTLPLGVSSTGKLLGSFGDWLDALPDWLVMGICLSVVAGVAALDFATGDDVNVTIFYIGPVVIATWLISHRAGLWIAGACAALWPAVGLMTHRDVNPWVYLWNILVLVAFLLLTVFLVDLARRAILAERAASRTDSLTGVANGRAFEDLSEYAINMMRRTRRPLTFCYLDLDHFKEVNDTLGHREGDELLSVLAKALESRLRSTDLVARLGGDEFGILLPDTDFEAADRVLADVSEAWAEAVSVRWSVGVTGGAVTFLLPPASADLMVNIADKLMYEVKQGGRGRIEHVTWPAGDVLLLGWSAPADR
jgi:diguanylate cyclase (GGDEF)-like protein